MSDEQSMTLEAELEHLTEVPGLLRQAAALAWLPGETVKFVIVTSRRTGRWVFPKGSIDPGMSATRAAAQEALEEAGVIGNARPRPIGQYRTVKIRPPEYWHVEVTLYPLQIDEILSDWMEKSERERRFVTLEEARDLITDQAMVDLVERFLSGDG